MATVNNVPANAAATPDAQAQVNGIVKHDQDKNRVAVHTFNPDATPEQKAATAGKGSGQLKSAKQADQVAGGKEVILDSNKKSAAIPPTITITDAETKEEAINANVAAADARADTAMPGGVPDGPTPSIPEWYKAGWRAVGGIDAPQKEGEEREKSVIDMYLSEQFYGAWYHNAAVVFFAVFATHFLTLFRFGWGWLFIVLGTCATYYSTSMVRVRSRARDDIQRELVKNRLVDEHESAEWINNFLDRFWLIYEPVLSTSIIQSVDQVLSQNTPPFLDSIRLATFTLGTKAPRIDKVRTFPKTPEDIITMDWGLSFTPSDVSDITPREASQKVNPKIVLSIRIGKGIASAAMPILLEDLNFTGLIRIRLKLMTSFPHVQVVDLSFLEKPVFDYVLKPIGGETFGFDIGNIPGLSPFIRDTVHSMLGPMMYDPNVFTLNLEQMLSGAPIDTAIGVLQVTLHNARGLKGSKVGGGSPDPYISLSINSRSELARTKHKPNTYNPTWDETKFLLINSLTEVLTFNVMDYNDHRKDFNMGSASFDLSKLQEDATMEGLDAKVLKDGKERGEIRFDLSFYPVLKPQKIDGGKEEELPDTKVGIVRLTIHQAKDLDHTKSMSGDLNPFAKVLLAANSPPVHETNRVKHTNNPVWESSTEFLCSDKQSSVVSVKIIDDRDFLKDPLIGYMSIRLEDLLEARKSARDWWPLNGCKSGRLRVSAEWKPLNMAGSLHGADMYVPPIGIVRLWVQKATDVKNVEAALGGKSDPYVRVQLKNVTMARTDVKNNNLSPEWDQILYIPVHSPKEVLLLECMDYQHLTKDRSLGSVELKLSDLLNRVDDPKFPYASTGKKTAVDSLKLDKGNSHKGSLHYVAEFVPAVALKGVSFEAGSNEIDKVVEADEGGDSSSHETSEKEKELIPDRPTVSRPIDDEYDEIKEEEVREAAANTKGHKKTDSANASIKTAGTNASAETTATVPPERGVEMSKEELMSHQAGIIVFSIRQGQLSQKARLEVLLDDGYWPAFSTVKPRSTNAQWDHVGEGFIKELDFGRVWFRLNSDDDGDKEEIISEFKCDARTFLEQAMSGPTTYTLTDVEEKRQSVIEVEARYVPVDIKLEARESISNMGRLRVDLVSGHNIRGVDRGGKSDPFVVFTLDGDKVFKSETVKKTLNPEWNESFEVQVPSRVGADFQLEVFDWNQIERAKSLGVGRLELADLEPFAAVERTILLSHDKHGEQGEIKLKFLFTPEIIARRRKQTSTFSSAGRAMTQIGGLPFAGVKEVGHGVGKVGHTVGGVFKRDHAKKNSVDTSNGSSMLEAPSGQSSAPLGTTDGNGMAFPAKVGMDAGEMQLPSEPGVLRVGIIGAKDLPVHEGDMPKPYVVVKIADKEQKTKHAGKTVTPEWNETFSFSVGPSQTKISIKVLDHKTLGKDRSLGEGEVDIWRHIQPQGEGTGADVTLELREGQGQLRLKLEFDAGAPMGRVGSMASMNRSPFGSPSRFSLSRAKNSDD